MTGSGDRVEVHRGLREVFFDRSPATFIGGYSIHDLSRHGVNVDFYDGVVHHLLGIPEDVFVPIFATGRVPGRTRQVLEQLEHNTLIRPRLDHDEPEPRDFTPIEASRRGAGNEAGFTREGG